MEDYEVTIREDYVFFEHNEYGEDRCVKFLVEGNVIVDYEGCHIPPKGTREHMHSLGYLMEGFDET